jgi:AraC-like DNA-binding protein
MRVKIFIPEYVLAQVEKVYEDYPYAEKSMNQIAKESGFNPRTLYNRAYELGFTNKLTVKRTKWFEMEKKIVEDNRTMSDRTISRKLLESGFNKTEAMVTSYKRKRKISWNNGDRLSASQIAEGLGVHHTTVRVWIQLGKLKGEKIEMVLFNETNPFLVTSQDLKKFIDKNRELIDLRRADKYFIFDVLLGRI